MGKAPVSIGGMQSSVGALRVGMRVAMPFLVDSVDQLRSNVLDCLSKLPQQRGHRREGSTVD